jgi:hypothetical protein
VSDRDVTDDALRVLALIELTMYESHLPDSEERIGALWPEPDELNDLFSMVLTFAAATVIAVDREQGSRPDPDGVDLSSEYVDRMRLAVLLEESGR